MTCVRYGFVVLLLALVPVVASGQSLPVDNSTATPPTDPPAPPANASLVRKLKSPRATMKTFLDAVNQDDLETAALCLDISQLQAAEEARKKKSE